MMSTIKEEARRRLDDRLLPLKQIDSKLTPPTKGWIRAVRDALGMTGTQFAARLGVSWQSMDDIEKSEAAGTIQLQTLRKAARMLDCTVVYALVPNLSLEQSVNRRARDIARRNISRVSQTMALEDQSVGNDTLEQEIDAYVRDHIRDRDIWEEK